MKKTIIVVVIVLIVIALFWLVFKLGVQNLLQNNGSTTTQTNPPTGGNIPPSTSGTTVAAKLGETITLSGVTGTLKELLQDSRCPIGVQCIQAGTVKVKVHFSYGLLSQDATLTLNEPFTMYGHSITLVGVKPAKTAGVTIAPADYVFTFSIK